MRVTAHLWVGLVIVHQRHRPGRAAAKALIVRGGAEALRLPVTVVRLARLVADDRLALAEGCGEREQRRLEPRHPRRRGRWRGRPEDPAAVVERIAALKAVDEDTVQVSFLDRVDGVAHPAVGIFLDVSSAVEKLFRKLERY